MTTRDTTQLFDKLSDYVALVGRGQKSGKTLNLKQARHIMRAMLTKQTLPEQTGALLMLLRMREETSEELAGFLQACRDTLPAQINTVQNVDIDFGCYAGKRRHLPWFLLAALVLAQNGYRVLLHGLEEFDSNRLYVDEVLKSLSWPQAKSIQEVSAQLSSHSISYISLQDLHPEMTGLLKLRHILGLRSCMHTVAKMLNPAKAKASVHGVYHRDLDDTHMKVAQCLQETNVACIRGDSGEVEATPEKAFDMHIIRPNGDIDIRKYPILLENWSHQTRQLGAVALKNVWTGETSSAYGEAAIIGTLAIALSSMHDLETQASLAQAKALWLARDKLWPIQ